MCMVSEFEVVTLLLNNSFYSSIVCTIPSIWFGFHFLTGTLNAHYMMINLCLTNYCRKTFFKSGRKCSKKFQKRNCCS